MSAFRIATYNVQSFLGYPAEAARRVLGKGNTSAAAAHFAHALSALGCQVLALQEGVTDRQIARVAAALEMHHATFPSPLYWPGHLLSRFPMSEAVRLAPPRSRGGRRLSGAEARPFSRMAGAARLLLPDGAALWVVTAHLHPRYRELREREAASIADQIRACLADTSRVIALGDFNCEPGESIHEALGALGFANAMVEVGGGLEATYDSTGRVRYRVDHIFVSPALRPALVCAETVRAPGFWHNGPPPNGAWLHSDHVPLIAELELAPH